METVSIGIGETLLREGLLLLFITISIKFVYRHTFGKLIKIGYKFGLLNKRAVNNKKNKIKKGMGNLIKLIFKYTFGVAFNWIIKMFRNHKVDKTEHPNIINMKDIREDSMKRKASNVRG